MVSPRTRADIWQDLLDANRLVRYYEALTNRYQLWQQAIRLLLLAIIVSNLGAFGDLLPRFLQISVALVLGLLIAWDWVIDPTKKAFILHEISKGCSSVCNELETLWRKIDTVDMYDAEAQKKLDELSIRIQEVTNRVGDAKIRDSQKMNAKCADATYRVLREKYAG